MAQADARWYFIPGLPQAVTDTDLRQHFGKYGEVLNASIALDKGTGQSRGFGYVEMADTTSQAAVLQDTHIIGGQAVSVMLTKDSLAGFNTNKVHLGKLPLDLPAEPIREVFSRFGVVMDVHLPKDPRTGERKNFGFVTLGSEEAVTMALSVGQVNVAGHEVSISPAAQSRTEMMREATAGGWAGGPWGGEAWGGCGPEWGPWQGAACGWAGAKGGCDAWPTPGGGPLALQNGQGSDGGASSRGKKKVEGTRYFLPGLPPSVGEYELREHFSRYGVVVDVAIVKEKGTEKSRGFGYVTMQDVTTREAIISAVHEFEGRPVTVMLTKDSLTGTDVKKVHLSRLEADVSTEEIREAMTRFGAVLDVHTPKDPNTGERKNFGFVTYDTQEAFDAAIAASSVTLKGQVVAIRPAAQCREGSWDSPSGGKGADAWGCWGGGCWGPGGGWGDGSEAWYGSDYWGAAGKGPCWGCGGKGGGCMASNGCSGAARSQPSTSSDGSAEGVKYFVAGLPDTVTDDELLRHFSSFGQVMFSSVVKEKHGDRSRGFGYVTLADASSQEALLNTKHVFGNTQISVMLTKESLTGGNVKKVHLGNLNADVTAEAIRGVFSQFGVILDVHTPKEPSTGERKNYGFVSFSTEEAFQAAINVGLARIGDCEVTIRPAAQSRMETHGSWDGSAGKGGKAWGGWDSWEDPGWDPWSGGKGGGMWDAKGYGKAGGWGYGGGSWGGKGGMWGKGYDKGCGKGGKWGCSGKDWGYKGSGHAGPY
mmetsp:Transcript_125060/g.365250  ORF Transcript_125060/g.365250 Transcript_125060/m.365250 type:complete len:761 (+) Transcript_125060:87-2369(+)